MSLEIHRPELETLLGERMKSGGFRNVEDVILQALQSQAAVEGPAELQQRLLISEGRFNRLLEAVPDAIVAVNRAGLIIFVNAVTEKMFCYRRDELLNQPMDVLMPERFRARHTDHKHAFFHKPRNRSMGVAAALFGQRKDGSEFPIEVSLSPMDGEGELLVCSSIRDISERLELEERLKQSQKMDAIGRLAGGVAHDFNNLLTVINGYSDLLMQTLDARDPNRDKIGQIRNAGKHAAELTQQLLAFSRRQILQPKILDLNQLVLDVEKMLRRVVGEDVKIVTVLSAEPELLMADPGQMTQVLMNLAVNARDAMPDGGEISIEITHVDLNETSAKNRPEMEPGTYVQLTISDTGIGMDEATQSHIFEPFFTTKGSGLGTGLGLSTIYGIVKQANGSIWVYSEPGRGTTFKIYLPRVREGIVPRNEPKPEVERVLRGDKTILVVEDQAEIRKLTQEILERYGYKVLTAASGGEGLLVAERHTGPIELMLTDVVMPGMTGRELANRLQPLRPAMKVLYMSGYTDHVVVHRGIVDLGVAYLQKPFTPEELAGKIRGILVVEG